MTGAGAFSPETLVVVVPVVKKFCQSKLLQFCPPPPLSVCRHSDCGARPYCHPPPVPRPVRRPGPGPPGPVLVGWAGGEEWVAEGEGGWVVPMAVFHGISVVGARALLCP